MGKGARKSKLFGGSMLASLTGCHFCFIIGSIFPSTYLCALYDSMSIGKGVNHLKNC